jgi:hypothetical protein
VTLNPPQSFKLWQFNPFGLIIPKMPPSHFFLKNKKKNPKKLRKSQKKIYEYMLGWPNHSIGGGWPPRLEFFFKKKKKCDEGILGIKRPNGLNCHNLKLWGG